MNFDNWYQTIHEKVQLTTGKEFRIQHFGSTGVVSEANGISVGNTSERDKDKVPEIDFLDVEPVLSPDHILAIVYNIDPPVEDQKFRPAILIANSDYNSKLITELTQRKQQTEIERGSTTKIISWYYFAHAFIALDWYRQYRFYTNEDLIKNRTFTHNFVTQNRLVSGARNYRLVLMSELEERGLTDDALVSYTRYQEEHTRYVLPANKITKIKQYCSTSKRFDELGDIIENQSMHINVGTHLSSFFNLVTETCFYESFNHLTEKTFRPIAMLQPFVLTSTPGSLAYLKRYGFKTFDQWIDERYDTISNPFKRIDAIVRVMDNVCSLSKDQQQAMYQEMLPTLIHNRNHFYNDLYDIAYKEMWDNFGLCYSKINP